MSSTNKKFFVEAVPLLLILLIDGMGLGLVFPILNNLIVDPSSQFAATLSESARNVMFGSIVAVFMLSWFIGAPFLGDLSDNIGRKKSLMICLLGAAGGYLVSGLGVTAHSLTLLIVGRVIAGFTSGSQPIAQAAIVDMSEPEHKTRNISLVLLALSCGFILGPLIGGIFSNRELVPWFSFSLPFYFAAAISLLNAMLLQFLFHETFTTTAKKVELKFYRAIEIFISAFKHDKIRSLSVVFLIMLFGWSSFYTFISMFLLKKFNLSPFDITIFMAVMGIGFGIGNGFLANYCAKRFPLQKTVVTTLLLGAIAILFTVLAPTVTYAWVCIIPIAALVSVAYAMILTIFSNQVDSQSQGWVMGITGAMIALTFGINSLLLGFLTSLGVNAPLYISFMGLLVSGLLMCFFQEDKNIMETQTSEATAHLL